MIKTGCSRWGLWGGLFVIALLCIVGVSLFYFQARAKAFNSRPLVLIHSPINHDLVGVGDGVLVHATAREDNGLRSIELWVDGQLIEASDAPDPVTNLTLSSDWMPAQPGPHVLVVRAISVGGVEGKATVTVQANASGSETHTVQEGETPDSIAADYGVSLEDLSASNPDLGSAAPGDELVIPEGGSPPGEEGEAPADSASPPVESGEPPSDEGAAPGSANPLFEFMGPLLAIPFQEEGTLTTLRVEVTSLQTSQSFDGLHCYVGMADGSPQWFPDADDDQTTDESFAALGDGRWDVEPYLAGDAALVIVWPDNQPLPLNISCVGIAGGGTDAVEFGQIGVVFPPEDWDGISRWVAADGAAGHIRIDYRVRRGETPPRGIPLWLDDTMTPPINVRLDERRRALRWDYNPRTDPPEEPITGFRIYLNGNLQWVEPLEARESRLPPEWFHPPCGSTYRFTVTAFRVGDSDAPDGPESRPGFDSVETPLEGCNRELQVIFTSLETFDLGSDGHHEHRDGDVGPAYGSFFANEYQITFSGGHLGQGGLGLPYGLLHNYTYNLSSMAADYGWHFSAMPNTVVGIPAGGSLQLGFHIQNENSGLCSDSYTRGCDRLICEATSAIYTDPGLFDRGYDGALTSDDGRCVVYFTFGPAPGSPVGSGVEGAEPLPWIDVEDLIFDPATGSVQVLVKNTGYAAWPWKDLDVELRTRTGDSITKVTWPGFVLERGQETILEFPPGTLERPYDACVFIDPDDKVLEHFERSGSLAHYPVCLALPDLIVSDVQYSEGTIHVMVQNVGDGALVNRSVLIESHLRDGRPPNLVNSLPNITLEPGDSLPMQIVGVSEDFRERMRGGYSVVVNLDASIAESDTSNNAYAVPAADRVWIYWRSVEAPRRFKDRTSFYFDAYIVSGEARRQVARWSLEEDIEDWNVCWESDQCVRENGVDQFSTGWFDIYGDETLEISILRLSSAHYPNGMQAVETFGQSDGWGGGALTSGVFAGEEPACRSLSQGVPGRHHVVFGYDDWGNTWETVYHICLESAGE